MRSTSRRRKTSTSLPASQQRAIRAVMQNKKNINTLVAELQRAYDTRNRLLTRIFDEIEKHPERYSHVRRPKSRRGEARIEPMTRALARRLKGKYRADLKLKPLRISGPGCDSFPACPDKEGCVCIFSVGTLCCYLCLSPKVIQCDF